VQSFSELPISPVLQTRLQAGKFTQPTPVQAGSIPPALKGHDVLATAQTGTGKTLAFLIPAMEQLLRRAPVAPGNTLTDRSPFVLILTPTRELAMQIMAVYDSLRGNLLAPGALLVGGMPEGPQREACRRGAPLMVATPGRLEDFLERKLVDLRRARLLVLDEADRMLDMGFLPSIKRIASILPAGRQTLCFSATMEGPIVQVVNSYMVHPVRIAIGSTSKPAENVRVQAMEVLPEGKQEALRRMLRKEPGRCLVFARTKRGTEKLARILARDGFKATSIHGDRTQRERNDALAGFQTGRYRVLVATDVAARGIHVTDIEHVINYELPDEAENFIHRVGRTGRAGKKGVASTLYTRDERRDIKALEKMFGIRMETMRETA
jgi:ATP-dependent RNA helicase RhlE